MSETILVVDDHAAPRRVIAAELEDAGYQVVIARDGAEAWECFHRDRPSLVLTDLVMPRSDGIELLGRIRACSETPVILFSAQGSVPAAVAALKAGAIDFISTENFDVDELIRLVGDSLGGRAARAPTPIEERIQGTSAAIRRVRDRIAGLASLRTPVLVCGEPGSGRSSVVRTIHQLGATSSTSLVRVDCARAREGDPLPAGGAVHLDGVERLPSRVQLAWERQIARSARERFETGPRILATSSRSLQLEVNEGRTLRSFADALTRFEIQLPPLRERIEDLPVLVEAFLARAADSLSGRRARLSTEAMEALAQHDWPGNLRELERVVERVLAYSQGRDVPASAVRDVLDDLAEDLSSIRAARERAERENLITAIRETGGNISRTAEILGKSRSAIYRMIAKYGIRLTRS